MDPVTHSLVGAALSRAGLNRTTPLATATLVLGANAPDVDALALVQGSYASLALRRGLTHGPVAALLLPLVVAGAVVAYDRFWRRRRDPAAPPASVTAVIGLAFLGVLTHSPLDWLNTYGIRLLMPFSERWFYGDSLFIIDPWVWLLLGAPLVAHYTTGRRGRVLWTLLAVLATALMLAAPGVPLAARALWVVAVAATAWQVRAQRAAGDAGAARVGTRRVRVALALVGIYIAAMIGADAAASRQVAAAARAEGLAPRSLMVAPVPANPLAGDVVVETEEAYHLGRFDWLASPRVQWQPSSLPKGERDAIVLATLQLQEVRNFLRWSRFPYVDVRDAGDHLVVRFGDARYPHGMRGGLSGISVEVARPSTLN